MLNFKHFENYALPFASVNLKKRMKQVALAERLVFVLLRGHGADARMCVF